MHFQQIIRKCRFGVVRDMAASISATATYKCIEHVYLRLATFWIGYVCICNNKSAFATKFSCLLHTSTTTGLKRGTQAGSWSSRNKHSRSIFRNIATSNDTRFFPSRLAYSCKWKYVISSTNTSTSECFNKAYKKVSSAIVIPYFKDKQCNNPKQKNPTSKLELIGSSLGFS